MNFLRRLFGQPSTSSTSEKPPETATKPVTVPPMASSNGAAASDITAVISLIPAVEQKPVGSTATGSPSSVTATPLPAKAQEVMSENTSAPTMSSTNGTNASNPPSSEPPMDDSMMPGATRQLPPIEPYSSKPGKHVTFGLNSDIGVVRTNNQDALYAMFSANLSADSAPDFGLFVVADGMGGHHDGEKASALTTRIIAKYVNEHFFLKLLYIQDDDDSPIISEVLNDAVLKANQMVGEKVPEGGTTCTAALVMGDLAYIAHVGDSRAYLISTDGIEQITRDHSLVQRLIELDQLTQDEAANHPQRNVLYRALGQNESIDVDTITRRLPPGSYLMLCSDGLWNHLSDAQLIQCVRAAKTPQEACDALVAKANERGGLDNISVVLVQIPG